MNIPKMYQIAIKIEDDDARREVVNSSILLSEKLIQRGEFWRIATSMGNSFWIIH